MYLIKKLDDYILRKFLLIFVGAFFVCLFVFMMQFTWRYVDELIGKGLTLDVLAQFFWYMGLTLVPQSLPLAILLASLITFGNLGESLELLAMKAAGVPLVRIMRPMALVSVLMAGVSFYFQNSTSPEAQINLRTLLLSMKQQSPAVEIPEGVFYNGVPNINLFVQQKNAETGMLYQTIIYKTDQGFDRAQIVLADSARLEITADKQHLKLDLWNGEQFESLQSTNGTRMLQSGAEQPYDRETFVYKQLLIDFDSNFNLMDKEMLTGMPSAKNMKQIVLSVDSMDHELDSLGRQYYKEAQLTHFKRPKLTAQDSARLVAMLKKRSPQADFGYVVEHTAADKLQQARQNALSTVKSVAADLEWKSLATEQSEYSIRRHWVEWHQKITLSLACIIFFFVGAPLGAIISKGGLGLPTVISVVIFIFWYIINTSGMKMARDGSVNMVLGMWVSTIIIAPFGCFITFKANKDSTVFNMEAYLAVLRRLLGLRTRRHIFRKEVIIEDPRMDVVAEVLPALREACRNYSEEKRLLLAPSYVRIFFRHTPDTRVEAINERLETLVEELSNSKSPKVLAALNAFPILYVHAHTSPFHSRWLNAVAGVLFPIGGLLWLRIWRFRLRLLRDMRVIVRTCDRLEGLIAGTETADEEAEQTDRGPRRLSPQGKKRMRLIGGILLAVLIALLAWAVVGNGLRENKRKAPDAAKPTKNADAPPQSAEDASATKALRLPDATDAPRQLKLPEKAPE